MSDARWGDPREHDARDQGNEWPRVYDPRDRDEHDPVKRRTAEHEKRVKAIQQKLDRLDDAFLFAETIDSKSYERQRDRLREELTLAQIDHHTWSVDERDVQGWRSRTHFAACLRRAGAILARSQAAAVLPGRNRVRRKSVQSNRRNATAFQLGAV